MVNAWVEHVRNFAKKNGISYGCAVSNADCKSSYHKQKARNAKKTRTPEQETEGMGAEDTDAVKKVKKPKKKKLIIKEEPVDITPDDMPPAYYAKKQTRTNMVRMKDESSPDEDIWLSRGNDIHNELFLLKDDKWYVMGLMDISDEPHIYDEDEYIPVPNWKFYKGTGSKKVEITGKKVKVAESKKASGGGQSTVRQMVGKLKFDQNKLEKLYKDHPDVFDRMNRHK